MTAQYIFYDLPSKDPCKAWSLNPWKTRLLLNYKNLPYETQWVEYPDIKPKFEKHIPPNKQGAEYTIPTIKLPDGSYMQDSRQIATRIEHDHPHPTVHLGSDYLTKLETIMSTLMPALGPEYIPKVPRFLLNEPSKKYFTETREARLGMSLDQAEREKGGDTAWMENAPLIQQVTELLKEKSDGPFFEGNQVSYVDFVWVSFLSFADRLGIFEKLLEVSGDADAHRALYKACDPWLARDDH